MAKAKKAKSALPDKLSALICVAVEDLRKVERSKFYTVDMEFWHSPDEADDGRCCVCLAGSVMAKTLRTKPNECFDWDSVDEDGRYKLYALDSVRQHDLECAIDYVFPVPDPRQTKSGILELQAKEEGVLDYPPYEDDPRAFKRGLTRLAAWLEERGL